MSKVYPTVVVTGATGFLGRYVIKRLLEEAVNIVGMVRQEEDADSFVPHERLSFVVGDITDVESLKVVFNGAWGLINAAGLREFWNQDAQQFYQLNYQGAVNVFEASLSCDVQHVVQASTPLAFGSPSVMPFNESTPAGPHASDYARSKYLGDEAGINLAEEHGLPLTIVYLAALIGAGDTKDTMEVRRAVNEKMPALVGADTRFTYLFVGDAAEALVQTLLDTTTTGKRYLIGKETATTREYFNLIGDIAGVKVPSYNIPEKILMPVAKLMTTISKYSGKRPELPLDVLKTTQQGSLLFDASLADKDLSIDYTPLSKALEAAVEGVREAELV